MSSFLREFSLDASSLFPWQELASSVAELRLMCMLHGVLNLNCMLLDEAAIRTYFLEEPQRLEQIFYEDRTPLVCEQFQRLPVYRERMRDVLLELYDCFFAYDAREDRSRNILIIALRFAKHTNILALHCNY